ncbi:hypothetical protein CBR_g30493 [Chara braunii]|uniref:DDE Tnp4 domain-containing protein n=1 Tax=Chara braunii TaxID=69332 RepID=A0A388LCV8_CHABU|nr:hypothetical protein CBR_g30493 [Chara braunii]|eukprot:GBG80126.1 hypothetical protein CBR_g30493 [Chara braunii]
MDVDGDAVHDTLSKAEREAVAAAVNMMLIRCQLQRTEGRMRAAIRARRKKTLQSIHVDEEGSGAICDAVLQVCYAMGCGAFPRATPRWWMKRRTGGGVGGSAAMRRRNGRLLQGQAAHVATGGHRSELARAGCVRRIPGELPRREDHPTVQFVGACRGRLLFTGPPVMLPFGVRTNGYLLGDNGYPPSEWVVVPYGGVSQHPSEIRFDNKQKTARGAVERAFGRLKGMWRLFLRSHKTNLDTLPQQFVAVCILHNILIDAGIPFDDNLLWEVRPDGVRRRVDLGMHRPLRQMCMESSTGDVLILRDALAERMGTQ